MSHVTLHTMVHPISPFLPLPSLNQEFNPILFCRSQPHILVGEVPARFWCGTLFWIRRLGAMSVLQVSSLSSVWCPRVLPVLSWRRPWLRGGRILPTPSMLLSGDDRHSLWLPPHDWLTIWWNPDHSQGQVGCSVGCGLAREEVYYWDDPLH